MPKVAFTLLQDRFISVSFCHKFGRFRANTGQYIEKKYWNQKTQRARGDIKFPQYLQLNNLLDAYANRIQDFYRQCLTMGAVPSNEDFKKAMNGTLTNLEKNPRLIEFMEAVISERSKSPDIAVNTIKSYRSLVNLLHEMKIDPRLSEVNPAIMDQIKNFMLTKRSHSINTASKYIKILKVFLTEAQRRDMTINSKYETFKLSEQPVLKTYLSVQELMGLKNHTYYSGSLRNAVDLFLIGAFTGLRFSDFSKLRLENIESIGGHEIIRIQQSKTGDMVHIPVHPVVREVIQKYKGIPRVISQQKMNDYIKLACQEAGLVKQSIKYFNRSGRKESAVAQKFQLISTHTARRSFATNAYRAGIPSMDIMRITGHRTEISFKRYICIEAEDAAVTMAANPFFNGQI